VSACRAVLLIAGLPASGFASLQASSTCHSLVALVCNSSRSASSSVWHAVHCLRSFLASFVCLCCLLAPRGLQCHCWRCWSAPLGSAVGQAG
jgi:hypothetical protein